MATINPETGALIESSDGLAASLRPAIRRTLAAHEVRLDALEAVGSNADHEARIDVLEAVNSDARLDAVETSIAEIELLTGNTVTTYAELVAAAAAVTPLILLGADITVTSALTIPLGVAISFGPYMLIKGAVTAAIAFNGGVETGRRQVFSGWEAGDIYGNFSTHEVFPEWWGLTGSTYADGQHDLAINAALRTYGPRGTLTITSAASASAGAETELTVTSIYSPATYYMAVGIRIRVEASSTGDTEYDGWWTVSAVTSTTVTIKKAWPVSGGEMTGSAYFTIRGSTGNRVVLAGGTYWVNSTIDARDSYCHLVGGGSAVTEIWASLNWTPSEWFDGSFYVWDQLNTDPNYSPLGWDAGMTTDATSHAYMVMFGSTSLGGGASFRAGMSGIKISGAYAVRKWPTRRISILGGTGWAEENMIFRDLGISSFSGFGIGWWGYGSINTMNGTHFENLWITNATRRGAIPIYIGSHANNCVINMVTIAGPVAKAQSSAWATDDTALGGTAAGAGRGTFTAAVTDVITTSAAHGLKVGDEVRFATTGTLPAGLTVGTRYYVITIPATNTMTVAATPSGTVINITDVGAGTHSWIDYVDDYPIFGIYCAGAHTDISNVHFEGCIKGIWVWGNDSASTVTIRNVDGYFLIDANMAYFNDPARVGGPETVSRSADGTCFKYSALVGIGSQFGQFGEATNFNSDVSITGLRCIGYMKYRLQDYSNGLEISAFGSGQYPNAASGTVVHFHRWQRYPAHTVTSTISTAATHTAGTKTLLTVASSAGVTPGSPGDTIHIASSSNQDSGYDSTSGFNVSSVPSGTELVIDKAWVTGGEMTGTFWKKAVAVTTNYEISY